MNFILDTFTKNVETMQFKNLPLWKYALLFGAIFITFFGFVFKIIQLQVFANATYVAQAQKNFEKQNFILPPRGIIYSSDNVKLVENKPYFALIIDLTKLNRYKTYTNINEILSIEEIEFLKVNNVEISNSILQDFHDQLAFGKDYYTLQTFFENDKFITYKSELSKIGVGENQNRLQIISLSYRDYQNPTAFSHILGYTGYVNEYDLKNDAWYTPNAKIGKSGLESYYEKFLRGEKGIEKVVYNSTAVVESKKVVQNSVAGASLYTSINYDLQLKTAQVLKEAVEKEEAFGGAVVVQNPNTGEILAMASYPFYDNNKFAKGIDAKSYQEYISDEHKPLYNRAISMPFPPASTFKTVMSIAGLQENSIKEDTLFADAGLISIGEFSYKTWKSGGHGEISVIEALKESSDTFFYVLGGGHSDYPNISPLGPWKIYKWARVFGFGDLLNIDLPEEHAGFVPTPEWKEETLDEPWYIGNTYHFSIGQGFLTATPLQVNTMIGAIANGGKIYKPFIVKKILANTGEAIKETKPEVISELMVPKEILAVVKEGLVQAASPGGTAYPLFDYPVPVAGKTGTAEYGQPDEEGHLPTHAWFTAFAPVNNPEISVTVFIENGGGGSDVAAPVAKEILDSYFGFGDLESKK